MKIWIDDKVFINNCILFKIDNFKLYWVSYQSLLNNQNIDYDNNICIAQQGTKYDLVNFSDVWLNYNKKYFFNELLEKEFNDNLLLILKGSKIEDINFNQMLVSIQNHYNKESLYGYQKSRRNGAGC